MCGITLSDEEGQRERAPSRLICAAYRRVMTPS
jgi:hypothetical protein